MLAVIQTIHQIWHNQSCQSSFKSLEVRTCVPEEELIKEKKDYREEEDHNENYDEEEGKHSKDYDQPMAEIKLTLTFIAEDGICGICGKEFQWKRKKSMLIDRMNMMHAWFVKRYLK